MSHSVQPRNILNHLDQVIPLVKAGPLGLLVDFDGTVSRIVPTPDGAMVSPRAVDSLRRLAQRLELVCLVSGRTARDLQEKVGLDGVMYVGNHGVEYLDAGGLWVAPGAAMYRDQIRQVFNHLRAKVVAPGLIWDDKYYSLSVHYRLAEDTEHARHILEDALDSATGDDELDVFWGKMHLEIRAPLGLDKGYALRKVVQDHKLRSVIVLGDDVTDLDGFAALREMRDRSGLQGACIVVLHQDTPDELVRTADYSLEGVREVEDFLEWLDAAVA